MFIPLTITQLFTNSLKPFILFVIPFASENRNLSCHSYLILATRLYGALDCLEASAIDRAPSVALDERLDLPLVTSSVSASAGTRFGQVLATTRPSPSLASTSTPIIYQIFRSLWLCAFAIQCVCRRSALPKLDRSET